ncbi:MAG: glycosyltransferase family 2 protein [Pseudomonadota bacterium]
MSDAGKPPTVSAIITVYNKAPFLPDTIRSLRRQLEDETEVEYVFADDASSDDSVAIIKDLMADAPRVQLIENTDNHGPSVRLNQAAAAAAGRYFYFLDGDDIATKGAIAGMLRLLKEEQADFIYGKTAKRAPEGADLLDLAADPNAPHRVSRRPLETVLGGGFVRMALMCRRDIFKASGGADEHIFVQDESLPLRLAANAARLIDWQANVITPPPSTEGGVKVSGNKNQLHHDAFLAYRNALHAFGQDYPDLAPKLYARAVSAYWKYARRQPGAAITKRGFWHYLQSKVGTTSPRWDVLTWMANDLSKIPNVRRV